MFYTVTPLSDEILSSWLIRSSIRNGTDPIGFSEGIWLNQRIWTKDIDRYFPQEKIQYLAKNTSLSFSQIHDLTLEPFYMELMNPQSINPKEHWPYIIPTGIRNRTKTNGLHFCPLCLKEPIPYMRKQWRLSWNCICEKHHILLQIHCNKCGNCFSPHLITYIDTDFTRCQYCKAPLDESNFIKGNVSVLQLQTFLNASLKKEAISNSKYSLKDIKVSDIFATIRGFMLFFRDIIHSKSYHKYRDYLFKEMNYQYKPITQDYTAKQISIDALAATERHQLLEMVASIFERNLDEIILLFKKADISKQLFEKSITLYSPTLIYIARTLKERQRTVTKPIIYTVKEFEPNTQERIESLMHDIRIHL